MKIKEALSEYALDWAAFVAKQKDYPFQQLKNKHIYVAGGQNSFARAVVYFLFALNDVQKLNIKVSLVAKNSTILNGFFPKLLKRDDFEFYTTEMLENKETFKEADFFIFTGYSNKAISHTPEFFEKNTSYVKTILSLANQVKTRHFIHLSDYRSYGVVKRGVYVSEYENGHLNFASTAAFESQFMQTVESLVAIAAKQYHIEYTVLRTGIVLGADLGLDESIFTDLFQAVCKSEAFSICNTKKSYSFVYISDVLKALFFSMTKLRKNTVYNVVGEKSTMSTGLLTAMVYDIYPEKCNLNLTQCEHDPNLGVSMNNQKIVASGCAPEVTMQQMIELMVNFYSNSGQPFLFADTYQGKLDEIHQILIGYLLEVDRICKKHNIKYFLAGGTLLGAIRHKGFIPWDDDADVMMLREDYEKFLSVVQAELPKNISLHTTDTCDKTHCVFTKLRIDNTMFATKFTSQFLDMHNGIFFDVLCHDKTANSRLGRKIHLQLTILTRSLVFNKWHKRKVDNGHKVQSAIANVLKVILPMRFLEWSQNKCLRFFENKEDAKYLYDGMGRNVYKGDFQKQLLDDTVYWEFEGYYFPIPKEYDSYLTYLYGDYMDMVPPIDRQTSHSIVVMDLGEYGKYKLPSKAKKKPRN